MELSSLLTGMNLILAGAIFGVVTAVKAATKDFEHSHIYERLMPLFPLFLGAIGGAIGAVSVEPVTFANEIVAGIMVGGVSALVFKIGKTTVMGKGVSKPEATEEVPDTEV